MALYHTHRPQLFKDIVGQEHITTTIINQIATGKIAHAYLFSGPRGIGKTTTARILAKALNCENKKDGEAEPCNECNTCKEISAVGSIDVIEIDAASHTGVDNVRQNIIENSQFKPTKSKHKVFIIDEVHMLSTQAFNALLKTLEEPPAYITFILATTDPHKLPITIVSRCQRYNFKKVQGKVLTKHIEKIAEIENIKIDPAVLSKVIKKSEGCVRDAVTLFEQIGAAGEKHLTLENTQFLLPSTSIETHLKFVGFLSNNDTRNAIAFLNELDSEGTSLVQFEQDMVEFLRYLLIYKIDPALAKDELDLSDGDSGELKNLADKIQNNELINLIDLTIKRGSEIKNSPLPQLPLEMLVVEWISKRGSSQPSTPAPEASTPTPVAKIENTPPPAIKTEVVEKKPEPTPVIKTEVAKSAQGGPDLVGKIKVEEKTEEPGPVLSGEDVEFSQVEKIWDDFLKEVESKTPSLVFILKMAKLTSCDKNIVKIKAQYKFHQEKMMEKKVKKNLEDDLSAILGSHVNIEIEVIEEKEKQEQKKQMGDLAAALGGEVIG